MSGVRTATEADERIAREIVDSAELPGEIEQVRIERGTDHTGAPALWLWFHLKSDEVPEPPRMSELTRFISDIESKIIASTASAWPHSRFADSVR